jgi:hypothetical protein
MAHPPAATPPNKPFFAKPAAKDAPPDAPTPVAEPPLTDDEQFKRKVLAIPAGNRQTFSFASPGELAHAQSLIDEVNAAVTYSTAVNPNANLNSFEVWLGKRP